MRVLDLFAGLGGWSQAFRDEGHEVVRVELDPYYEAEVYDDVLSITVGDSRTFLDQEFDLVLASPPCEKFSIMAVSHYWRQHGAGFIPKNPKALDAMRLAMHTLYLLEGFRPKAAIMENPRGMMRKVLPVKPDVTVTYCQYGDTRMKPTDLWLFGAAQDFYFKPMCKNGATCHEASPRGSRTGTQTPMSYHERSLIPYDLSLSVCGQMEQHLDGTLVPGRLGLRSHEERA